MLNFPNHSFGNLATISIYTDHFVLSALCEYALASGSDQDYSLIKDTYDAIEHNVHDRNCKDLFHGTWSPRYKRHAIYMMTLSVAGNAENILGTERTTQLIDHCLEQIGIKRNDQSIIDRAIQITDWAYSKGYDSEYGGIFSFLDASGREPMQMDWHKETNMMWHDKAWWVHCETLYTLILSAVLKDDPKFLGRFMNLHNWCQKYFFDQEYGEWYPELHRDGRPKSTDKGSMWKGAYHLPRALMKIMKLPENCNRSARDESGEIGDARTIC